MNFRVSKFSTFIALNAIDFFVLSFLESIQKRNFFFQVIKNILVLVYHYFHFC